MHKLLSFTIVLIFFPVTLQFQGFDAITTGTLAIFALFGVFFMRTPAPLRGVFSGVVILLILLGLASTLSIESGLLGGSFRVYVASCAGWLLFFLVINMHAGLPAAEQYARIEWLLSFILYLYALQILVGIVVYVAPQVGAYFSLFTTSEMSGLQASVTDSVKRLTTVILPREAVGEVIALLTPVVLYKILAKGNAQYYIVLAIYFIGVTLSATRSGFLLFFFAMFLFGLSVLPMVKLPTWAMFLAAAGIIAPLVFIQFPDLFRPIFHRLGEFFQLYAKSKSLSIAINRAGVWHYVQVVLLPDLSLWGNGFLSLYQGEVFNFHNLYATVFHRLGIVGGVVFFSIFYRLLRALWRSRKQADSRADKALVYACLTSVLVLLINETKYEFIRAASYQQTIWLLLGLYYAVALYVVKQRRDGSGQSTQQALPAQGLLARHGHRARHARSAGGLLRGLR